MLKRIKKLSLPFGSVILFLLIGCTCSNNTNKEEAQTKPSKTNFPEGMFLQVPNESKTFLLLIENQDKKEPIVMQKKIYVYNKSNDEIVLEDFIPNGKAFWKSETEVQIEKYPGMISKNETDNTFGYIFDVITREKTEIK